MYQGFSFIYAGLDFRDFLLLSLCRERHVHGIFGINQITPNSKQVLCREQTTRQPIHFSQLSNFRKVFTIEYGLKKKGENRIVTSIERNDRRAFLREIGRGLAVLSLVTLENFAHLSLICLFPVHRERE